MPVVAIGASAGGLEPIGRFLEAMPTDAGLAVVVIQHLDPTSKSMLPELLARRSALNVSLAKDGTALLPNQVYVIPPAVFLSIASGRLHFAPVQDGKGARRPIDVFLYSLAADRGRHGIGIIMSGTGTDGADGLRALKEAGGLALVQDPNEAQQDGMPRHAMLTAHPDHVLSVRDMPAILTRYVTHDYVNSWHPTTGVQVAEASRPIELAPFVEILKSGGGLDFGHYKTGTLQRRIERRMALNGVGGPADYLTLLRNSPPETDALAKDLLINVTGFFRDPRAFAALAEEMPGLLRRHPPNQPLRIWVAGCSTGEEAYSLGTLALEQIAAAHLRLELQIFATDVDQEALQIARAGVYPETIQADLTPNRLERFFVRENGHLRVDQQLRKAIIFSRHDALHDPPFLRLDLVSCRNVLIYLLPEAQRQLLTRLHFSLRDDGLLFLGTAESVGLAQDLFEPLDEKQRIYRRRGNGRPGRMGISPAERERHAGVAGGLAPPLGSRAPSLQDLVQRAMLEAYAPAAVVVNRQLVPLYFFGVTDRYLQVVAGEPNRDLLSMAREGLRPKLRETIMRAFRGSRRIAAPGVWFKREGRAALVTIEAQRLTDGQDDVVLVSFIDEPSGQRKAPRPPAGKGANEADMALLRQQLTDTRRELDRTIHDLQEVNRELKGKNEEAMSLNEEYLSANEELESSKEELQSLNEELTTVNSQLRQTLEQQQQASADLSNLLNSSAVATIFLDAQLRIKIFNPRMMELFSLIDADIGRPLADLLPKFADPMLLADATAAQATGTPSEREIRAETGVWYLRSVVPYRIETGQIAGAVVAFADVSRLKHAEQEAIVARRYAETILDTIRDPLVVLDADLRVVSVNAAFLGAFGAAATGVAGRSLRDLAAPLSAQPQLMEMLTRSAAADAPINHVELELDRPGEGRRIWRASVRHFRLPSAEQPLILLSLEDVTDERHILRRQLQMLIDCLPGAFMAIDDRRQIRFVSDQIISLFGYAREELIGQRVELLVPQALRERHADLHENFLRHPVRRPMGTAMNITGVTKDGHVIPLDIGLGPVATADGPMVIAAIQDLRPQRDEERLRAATATAERANQAKSRFLAAASHDLRQPLQTIELLHGVLQRRLADPESRATLASLDEAVAHMTELLASLLDINRIDTGDIRPDITDFPVAPVLARLYEETAPIAASKGLQLRTVPCAAVIRSDRRLLERMLGNLVSNAIKYTDRGKILLGCRHRGDTLRIEVWDTGIGISADNLDAIFEEFYQVDRAGTSKSGLGLGLYIVQRFAQLLGHAIEVRSVLGKGTMLTLVIALGDGAAARQGPAHERQDEATLAPAVLLVEDDPQQADALRALLEIEGYRVMMAATGNEALGQLRAQGNVRPHIIIADYNLPGGLTGLDTIRAVWHELGQQLPAVVVSGDRSAATLGAIEAIGLMSVAKPVKTADLLSTVDALARIARPGLQRARRAVMPAAVVAAPRPDATIAIIEDETGVREALRKALESDGYKVATFPSGEAFFAYAERRQFHCLVVDLKLPGLDGVALQDRLRQERSGIPIIFVTGSGSLSQAVKAMREGAADFLQKPVRADALRESVGRVLASGEQMARDRVQQDDVAARLARLTERERQVMERVVAGQASKNIAADLRISERTVEHHRHSVMRKIGAKSLAMLVRLVAPHIIDH